MSTPVKKPQLVYPNVHPKTVLDKRFQEIIDDRVLQADAIDETYVSGLYYEDSPTSFSADWYFPQDSVADLYHTLVQEHQTPTCTGRNRILLRGANGVGKETFARALAARLDRPFVLARYENLLQEDWAHRMEILLKYLSVAPCVVYFPQIERVFEHDWRVALFLEQQFQQLPFKSIFIAGTTSSTMGRAFFQTQAHFPAPSKEIYKQYITKVLLNQDLPTEADLIEAVADFLIIGPSYCVYTDLVLFREAVDRWCALHDKSKAIELIRKHYTFSR